MWSENGPIFASESGDALDRLYITTHRFKPLLERAGLPQTRFLYSPPPKAEPEEPKPVEVGLTRAHQLLGVPLGASRQQVGQAYRRLAFMYHPDRVAGMDAEARQYSEERMKEINAACSELRRLYRGTGRGVF